MRTILFTWELGGGLGHMMQILPLARELRHRGHRIFVAVRDLSRARTVFGDGLVTLLQAPAKVGPPADPFRPPYTFAHILHNVGYADFDELAGLVAAWRGLIETIRPNLILFDHSPTALLASRGFPVHRITMGAGFFCPPNQHPLPNLRSWASPDPAQLKADEDRLLSRINHVLAIGNVAPLDHIAQLHADVDDTFLLTFRELDHYPNRPEPTRYRGAWVRSEGKPPQWPGGSGKRIYAYLKSFPTLPHLLEQLRNLGNRTLVFVDGIDPRVQERFACPTLRFENQRLDIKAVAAECDVSILNANHGTAVALLLAGKPLLQLPIYLEQGMFAYTINRMGAALQADIAKPQHITAALQRMLTESSFTNNANAFAARYKNFDPECENNEMVDRIESLL